MSHKLKVKIKCQEETVQQVVGERVTQTLVRGAITIPDKKPKAEQILAVRARVLEEEQEEDVIPDKVIVQGKIALNITFVADFPGQPVHHVRGEIEFAESLDIPGARPGLNVVKQITIEKVMAEVDPRDPRRILVTIILRIFVKVTEVKAKQLLIDLPGAENRFKYEMVELDIVKAMGEKQVVVSDQVDILQAFMGMKPCPEEVLDTITSVKVDKTESLVNKVIVEGTLTVQIMYVADFPTQPVHHADVEIPFVAFVDLPGLLPGDMVNVRVRIEDVDGRVKNDCEIAITAVLDITAQVVEQIEKKLVVQIDPDLLKCLEDAEAIREVTLFLDRIMNEEDQVQVTLREIVTIPMQKPDAEKVLDAFITDITVTETEVIPDKVIVRGVVSVKVTFVANKPAQPVHAFEAEVPFTTFIDVPGAMPGADVNVMVDAEFVQPSLEDLRRVAIKLVLRVTVRVGDIVQRKVFECLKPGAEVDCPIPIIDPLT